MSSKFKLQVCGNARKSSIFRDNQFIYYKYNLFFRKNIIVASMYNKQIPGHDNVK